MPNQRQIAGKIGEERAAYHLRKTGYKIIDRNFRTRNGEIDIIAIEVKTQTLVFVEVKTRLSTQFGTPFEAIGFQKQQALKRTAEFYKVLHPNLPESMRIDAVAVMLDSDNTVDSIEHMKNIVE